LNLLLILALIFSVVFTQGQSMRTIGTKDGLPQSFVSGIVQDDSSFIWISTRDGLVRFDGIQYRVFQHHDEDTTSLASNLIIWMQRDPQNHLWIEHESGQLDEMDPVTEKITHYLKGGLDTPADLLFIRRGWLVDQDGLCWGIIKGKGINTFDRKTRKVAYFNRINAGLSSDTVRGITQTNDHRIWILTQGALSCLDKTTQRLSHWSNPFKEDYGNFTGSDAVAIDLHERKNAELMWGDRQSLFFFNPASQVFRKVSLPNVSYLGVRWIRTGPDGSDYLESYGNVFNYSDSLGLTTVGKTIAENFGDAKSFLVDRSGLLWIGTNARGIKQIDLSIPYFQSYPYKKDFLTDLLRQEWSLDMPQTFSWIASDNLFSSPSYQFRSAYDANNRLYISLKRTVCYVEGTAKKFVKLPDLPPDTRIIGLTITSSGNPLVIGTNGDIFLYEVKSKMWSPFLDTGFLRRRFGNSLFPLDILADDKSFWITTENDGLLSIDIQTKHIRHFAKDQLADSFPTNVLLSLRADPVHAGILWVGSFQGLIRLDKATSRYQVYSLKEGLPDNTIYSILSDRTGNLWVSTNKGICRFEPTTGHVRVFSSLHGLPADEFNRFHQLRLPDGRLVFGSTDGWTIFDPIMVKHDDYDPLLATTELKINNREVSPSQPGGLLRVPLNTSVKLTLPYDQNTLSIGFAALEFSQPQELQYRYRLEGYDNDWVQAGKAHQAIYTKIPPGSYTLYLNATNTSGKWSKYVKAIELHINSPWWLTPLAYMCYAIILAGLIWTFIRFRVSRMMMKQEMALKEMETNQLKELDDMKSRFFSNITHEFRTPLTLIMGPAEQLKTEHLADSRVHQLADGIIYNSEQLLSLVNRLMELAKLESRTSKLLEQRGSPSSVTGLVVHSFETDAKSREVHLSFSERQVPNDCWFYADALERIVYNLVSNALKFTLPSGQVQVFLEAKDDKLILIVKDTGIGIAENRLPFIFDRFYQVAENTRLLQGASDRGTGIGLAMVKELVSQMGGKIDVVSQTGYESGTCFTVAMPMRASALNAEAPAVQPEIQEDASSAEVAESRTRILVVEDSSELAAFISGILSEQYDVKHALNGAIGLEETLLMMPDLIISDVMMPVMDGFEFCRRVKEDIRTSHIPIILLTAKASQEDLIEGLTRGANDYLAKPFHPTELLLRIHNLLDAQQKLRDRVRMELSRPGVASPEPGPPVLDVFLTKLYSLLDEHLDDAYFGVDQLADLVHMSRSSIHRKLKGITGLSTTEVVRNFRLAKAAEFLRQGYSSSDVAYKSGFGSPAYFTKCFREVYGLTPTDFISQLKNNA
jgi:signal transduction histidine kinase/AraC-like DNA-binding protein/streptogramin lyase